MQEYLQEFEKHWDIARWNMVWYILKKDWYIDSTNDKLIKKIDKFFDKIKIDII